MEEEAGVVASREQRDDPVDLRYSNAPQRRSVLSDLVRARGFCSSAELGQILEVSEMTVRRDIRALAEIGKVLAVHGGAAAVPEAPIATMTERSIERLIHKTAIGREAATLIRADSVLGFDTGTTVLAVAKAVCESPLRPLALTNSLPVLNQFATVDGAHVVSLGGVLNAGLGLLVLNERSQTIGDLRVDQLFLGTSAVRGDALYCGTTGDARTKAALLEIAEEVVLVADSSKFVEARRAMTLMATLDSISTVVTDWEIADDEVARLEAKGLRVLIAEPPSARTIEAAVPGSYKED
jgi:DeoR/GlpR family transcriptional regulator of sugar metabolism